MSLHNPLKPPKPSPFLKLWQNKQWRTLAKASLSVIISKKRRDCDMCIFC